jgi:peroxiredoxin
MSIAIGNQAPDFTLPDEHGNLITLSSFRGKFILLVFYPGDDTPVCTAQLCSYRDAWADFQARNVQILGINADSVESHEAFGAKHRFPFPLLSDNDKIVIAQYGAKGFFGMTKRSYVLVDPNGTIIYHDEEAVPLFSKKADKIISLLDTLK